MQKIVNVLAIASTVVSASVVGGGLYVYVNRASIIDGVKSQVMESVTGSLGGLGGVAGGAAGLGAGTLPIGTNDLSPDAPQASPESPQALKPF
tara:strand:- start:2993 stop:3271 length:279 start_codon:yes stop_codon:yes gene_type:complete